MRDLSSTSSYTTSLTVDQTPAEVFAAINDVRGWWTGEIDGATAALGDEFTYRHGDVHVSTQRIIESTPGERVVWLVVEAHLAFTADPGEWTGTEITFDIARAGGQTVLRFTHVGLVPQVECFDACSNAWGAYVSGGLRNRITSGRG